MTSERHTRPSAPPFSATPNVPHAELLSNTCRCSFFFYSSTEGFYNCDTIDVRIVLRFLFSIHIVDSCLQPLFFKIMITTQGDVRLVCRLTYRWISDGFVWIMQPLYAVYSSFRWILKVIRKGYIKYKRRSYKWKINNINKHTFFFYL